MAYDLFRAINAAEKTEFNVRIANFIENHVSSTTVSRLDSEIEIKSVLTKTHRESFEETLLFTYPNSNVKVGEYFRRNSKIYLTVMEYDHPLIKHYLKHNMVECNIVLKKDNLELHGAYKSSMRVYLDQTEQKSSGVQFSGDIDKPMIIASNTQELRVNDRFLAAGDAFKVLNIDRLSNSGIMYLSVEPIAHNEMIEEDGAIITPPDIKEVEIPSGSTDKLIGGTEHSVTTVQSFVRFYPSVTVTSRTANTIKFKVPFGIKHLIVETKNKQGDVISKEYEVL